MEVDELYQDRHMKELKENYVQESREVAHAAMSILRKKPLSSRIAKGEEDYGAIMSTNISTYDDCLFFDGIEQETKEIKIERLIKPQTKREVKCKEIKTNNEPRRKKKKTEEKNQTDEIEEKDHKCSDAYEEWKRQKSLGLKYFSLPSFIKPSVKQAKGIIKKSTVSQANTSNSEDVACPKVIKAFYSNSSTGENLKPNVVRIFRKRPKKVFYEATQQPTTKVDTNAEAPVIDLTETSDDQDPLTNVPTTTLVRAINLSNANTTTGRPAVQRTRDENRTRDLQFTLSYEEPTLPGNSSLPVIIRVHSLANESKKAESIAERSASVQKKLHTFQKIAPKMQNAPKKPEEAEIPLVPLPKVLPGGVISLVPIRAPVTITASKKSLPTVTVSPMSVSPSEQSLWLPLPAAISTSSIPQKALQSIFKLSLPNQQESSLNSKSGHNLAQVRTMNTEGGRYFVLVPKSMQNDPPKTTECLLKKVQAASKTSIEESPKPRSANFGTLQPVESIGRCKLPLAVIPKAGQDSGLQNFCITPVETWMQNKMADELKILRVDASRPHWTPKKSYLLITESDLVCEMPVYWSIEPPESRCRIMFPAEKEGFSVYNPKTVQVSESAAIGTTAFAKWVRSVLELDAENMLNSNDGTDDTEATIADVNAGINEGKTKSPSKDMAGAVNETNAQLDGEDKPFARLKVKSFARITDDECDLIFPPERVSLRGKIYMKVSDEPLKYAQVLTVVTNPQEARCLSTLNAKLYILPDDMQSVCEQAQGQPASQSNQRELD